MSGGDYTPGPWRVGKAYGAIVADVPTDGPNGADDVQAYGGHLVAESVAAKNRAVIAAAPTMHAALQRIADLRLAEFSGPHYMALEAVTLAQEAINAVGLPVTPAPAANVRAGAAGLVLQLACHDASVAGGWWSAADLDEIRERSRFGVLLACQKLLLVHSEVSEGCEGLRKDRADEHLPHRKSIEVELADAVIRIADLAGALRLDLGGAIAEKLAYNATRADHKPQARAAEGGKAF